MRCQRDIASLVFPRQNLRGKEKVEKEEEYRTFLIRNAHDKGWKSIVTETENELFAILDTQT